MITPMGQMPGIPNLVADYLDNHPLVADFYNGDFRDSGTFVKRSEDVRARALPLEEVTAVLRAQNQRYGCGSHTLDNLDLLKSGRACAVVTGQQAGLFSGPLYTLYKALTTIKLAARLNRTCDGCYVPVFWLASDDHDFREVNHIRFVDRSNELRSLEYTGHPADARVPMHRVRLNGQISELLHALDESTHPSDFKQNVLRRLSEAYRPERSFSDAFGAWLMALCKAFGVILIDASDRRLKALGGSVFGKEIAEGSPSTQRALMASTELEKRGYPVQVPLHEGLLNLFFVEQERLTLKTRDSGFRIRGTDRVLRAAELQALLKERPEVFSPNVLLRPIYQDVLLPTVAYVAGPSEISYYAQMKGIYEAFDLPMPIIYPRKSLTLLEGKIEKVLDKYDLSVPDFWGDVEGLITQIVRSQLPESLEKRIENAGLCVGKNLQTLQEVVGEFDPTLTDTVEKTKNKMLQQMESLEKKILQAYKKQDDVIGQQIRKAGRHLYPDHALQERVLNVVPFLFKYDFELIERLYEALDIAHFDHQIVRL